MQLPVDKSDGFVFAINFTKQTITMPYTVSTDVMLVLWLFIREVSSSGQTPRQDYTEELFLIL